MRGIPTVRIPLLMLPAKPTAVSCAISTTVRVLCSGAVARDSISGLGSEASLRLILDLSGDILTNKSGLGSMDWSSAVSVIGDILL